MYYIRYIWDKKEHLVDVFFILFWITEMRTLFDGKINVELALNNANKQFGLFILKVT